MRLRSPSTTQPTRKNIRLPVQRYIGRQSYFVTLCFNGRRRYGANARIAKWIIGLLQTHAATCEFFIYAYCVMPDHVHILAAGASESSNLAKLIEGFKQQTGVAFSRRTRRTLWQSKYYDHILREEDSFDRVAWYIWLNPVRKGLCAKPSEYAFSGSFTVIGRKLLAGSAAAEWLPPWKTALQERQIERQHLPG